jgi:hypothetical protein
MNEYIYIRTSKLQEDNDIFKFGYTKNFENRLLSVISEHSKKAYYKKIYKIRRSCNYILTYKQYDKIFSDVSRSIELIKIIEKEIKNDLFILRNLSNYLIDNNGGNEFVSGDGVIVIDDIVKKEFHFFGLILEKEFSDEEIEEINKCVYKKRDLYNKIEIDILSNWKSRVYQIETISYALIVLNKINRFYLYLATGGGKSYIVYKIFNSIEHNNIIIFTPRIQITKQNINIKYLDILSNTYNICNFTLTPTPTILTNKNNIIIACIQSYKKVKKFIKKHKLKKNIIWFDEAHFINENWVKELNFSVINNISFDKKKLFFLKNNKYIKYIIFTSASPEKKLIQNNSTIFGSYYNPITVSELIKLKYLSSIEPRIYINKANDISILKYVLNNFSKLNKQFGFSFHSLQESAYNMFKSHYLMFINGKTEIKPFLLIGDPDKYINNNNINLDYLYTDINNYENTPHSIAYVVQKYSMGYDFYKIDYIIFSDPKYSSQNIIQCIGRGTRPDKLGINGTNLNKILTIMLPIYIGMNNNFDKIINVLRYLIHDFDIPFETIRSNIIKNPDAEKGDIKQANIYDGLEDIESKILNLISLDKNWNLNDFITFLKDKKTINNKLYLKLIKSYPEKNLPKDPFRLFKDFGWELIKDSFYTKNECINRINEIIHNNNNYNNYKKLNNTKDKIKYLHSIDNKLPNNFYWNFYKDSLKTEFII